jgi:SNF2 family DNA or RNA helicase
MSTLAEYREFLKRKVQISGVFGFEVSDDEIHPSLKPFQRIAVKWAVRGGRRALFEAFGLGKTRQQLEILRKNPKRPNCPSTSISSPKRRRPNGNAKMDTPRNFELTG